MAESVYVPSTLKEGYFADLPAPVAGDDARPITYNHATLSFVYSSAFAAAGHTHSYQPLDAELTAIADLTSAANTVPSFTGLGTAALLTVGTGANNLVQLTAASQLPAVDGSLLTNLPSGGSPGGSITQVQYNNAGAFAGDAGMTYDAANDRLTIVGGIIGPSWRPASDSTSALQAQNAAGNAIWTFDTANRRAAMNGATSTTNALIVKPNGADNFMQFVTPAGTVVGEITYGDFIINAVGANTLDFRSSTTAGRGIQKRIQNTTGFYNVLNLAGYVLFGVTATGVTRLITVSTVTNAAVDVLTLRPTLSPGTVAAGFGASLLMQARTATVDDRDQGRLKYSWIDATDASRASKGQLTSYYTSTERPSVAWGSNSSVSLLSFHDVTTPIAKPTITGSRGGNAALADLLTQLAAYGLIVDGSSA